KRSLQQAAWYLYFSCVIIGVSVNRSSHGGTKNLTSLVIAFGIAANRRFEHVGFFSSDLITIVQNFCIKRVEVYTLESLASRIQALCCIKMVEDVPNAVYHCNGGNKKTYTEAPVIDNRIGCSNGNSSAGYTDLCDERVLSLVARHANWNPFSISFLSCLCKKTGAISDRHLWREFCRSRAPRMVSDLLAGAKNRQIDGGWRALECRRDILYVSDPCEHDNSPEDVGLFRGVFRSFDKSETKKLLIIERVPISEGENCPYCKAGVWNMKRAQMIPKSASTRLAAYNENIDYSVCLNGHVNGTCALLHLPESDESDEDE
ncbi:hypothetical protein GOP47_0022561, partial [Adiantum capillus-veneris]